MNRTVLAIKIKEDYFCQWKTLKGKKLFLFYMIHYTILFLVLQAGVFSLFKSTGKSFIWTVDGMPGAFSYIVYLSQTVRDGIQSILSGKGWTIPLYDFHFGIAKPYYVFEPLQWLAILCPWDRIDIFYNILAVTQYYLVGLSFSIFGFYFRQKPLPILIGSISYAFCGFTLYAGVRHLPFMTPVIIFPMLIIGVEEIFKNGKEIVLTACVFLSVISNVYFACMQIICVIIYVVIRYFDICRNQKKSFIGFLSLIKRFAYWGGLGILLGAFSMLPNLLMMLGTGRIGRNILYDGNLWSYTSSYYQKFLANFAVTPYGAGSWTYLGFSALTVPAIFLLFVNKNENTNFLKKTFIILTIMMCCPAVTYVMSGFNTLSNRWGFVYAFCVCAILMFQIPHLVDMNNQKFSYVGIGVLLYLILRYFVVDLAYSQKDTSIFLALSVATLLVSKATEKKNHMCTLFLCFVVTCFSVRYSGSLRYKDYVPEFTDKEKAYQEYFSSSYSSFNQSIIEKENASFYRVASNDILHSALNASFYYDINGISCYDNARIYSNYINWINEMELSREQNYQMHCYGGLSTSSPLMSLFSVKYYVLRNPLGGVCPYGFQEIKSVLNGINEDLILENKYALPLGYTYSQYLLRDKYNRLSGLEKQEAQLQSVILDQDPSLPEITECDFISKAKQIPFTILNMQGVSWNKNRLRVSEEDATMTLAFNGLSQTETYLRVINLDLTSGSSTRQWNLTVATEETSASAHFVADAYLYAHGVKTQLLDLGYTEEGYTVCTITFPAKGTFMLEDLQIWCQPMDKYEEQIGDLRSEPLENIKTNWRGLTGDLSVSENKILCLAIPYDRGWTAYMDGQKVKLLNANTAFMAIEVPVGKHEIELRYMLPGLPEGVILSLIGLALLVATNIYQGRKFKFREGTEQ